jgi:hypothetical protein
VKPPIAYQEHSYTVPSGAMGRQKIDGNYSPPKNNLIQGSEGNEENRHPVPDLNKTR